MIIQRLRYVGGALGLVLVLLGCSSSSTMVSADAKAKPALPPEPVVNHSQADAQPGHRVVIFPTNVWEYDVLDYFPFNTPEAKAMAAEAKRAKAQSQGK